MVNGTATLVIDLGNSSTKCKVLFGKDSQTGKYRERKFELSNVFAPIAQGYEVSADYNDSTSTILSVDTELNGRPIKGHFCNGDLQLKEKPLSTIKPSASDKKYNLESTVLSYRLAFLFAHKMIMNMQRVTDYSQLDITWNIVTLLPPGDLETGKEPLTNIIRGVDKVDSVYPAVTLNIKIDKVVVLPECFCAYTGTMYDSGRVFRKGYERYAKETVLIIDIGAGTSDMLIVDNNQLVQNSKKTINQGGNNVLQLVRRKLMLSGINIRKEAVQNGIILGVVKDGAKEVSIIDIVNEAKKEVAQVLVSEVQDFFELTGITAQSIGYLLLCGGGSMRDSEVAEIIPLSDAVAEFFKALSPNTQLIDLPKHTVTRETSEGVFERIEEQISPRDLNLIGAGVLAEMI